MLPGLEPHRPAVRGEELGRSQALQGEGLRQGRPPGVSDNMLRADQPTVKSMRDTLHIRQIAELVVSARI